MSCIENSIQKLQLFRELEKFVQLYSISRIFGYPSGNARQKFENRVTPGRLISCLCRGVCIMIKFVHTRDAYASFSINHCCKTATKQKQKYGPWDKSTCWKYRLRFVRTFGVPSEGVTVASNDIPDRVKSQRLNTRLFSGQLNVW